MPRHIINSNEMVKNINTLKINFNQVSGYYLDSTKSNYDKIQLDILS